MPDTTKQGLVKKYTLTEAEVAEITRLIDVGNAHDNLHMRIGLDMLRERSGDSINDFLYYEDGQLVGYLWVDSWGKRVKEIMGMVHPAYRRRGIATALLAAAKEEYRGKGVHELILICEHSSQAGLAFVASTGAHFANAEHEMWLGTFHERGRRTEGLSMRQASASDIDTIVSILATDSGNREDVEAWVTHLMGLPQHRFYLATFYNEPLGCLRLDFLEDDTWIYAFEVRLGYRGLGYGRQMLEQAIHIARAENQKPFKLDVDADNTNAVGLYLSCGFEIKTTYDYYEIEIS